MGLFLMSSGMSVGTMEIAVAREEVEVMQWARQYTLNLIIFNNQPRYLDVFGRA